MKAGDIVARCFTGQLEPSCPLGTFLRPDTTDGHSVVLYDYKERSWRTNLLRVVTTLEHACIGDDSDRLRADNARLAESMAKLEDAVGMMREQLAGSQVVIAEQATELRKLRRR